MPAPAGDRGRAVIAVDCSAWSTALGDLHAEGFVYLDFLTGVDRIDSIEIVARVVDPSTLEGRIVATRVTGGSVASIASLFPAAGWHERETAEMFGIAFDGHPDPRPLLLHAQSSRPPLLKSTVLAARAVSAWPGGVEIVRRSQRPAGVPDDWLKPR